MQEFATAALSLPATPRLPSRRPPPAPPRLRVVSSRGNTRTAADAPRRTRPQSHHAPAIQSSDSFQRLGSGSAEIVWPRLRARVRRPLRPALHVPKLPTDLGNMRASSDRTDGERRMSDVALHRLVLCRAH